MKSEIFLREYGRAIDEGYAAVFVGAGVSVPAGYVNWRELLREIADDLDLDIDREADLISLAQYHVTERGTRDRLNAKILREFTQDAKLTPTHELIARLPINSVWTTNYDTLLERAYDACGKRVDVKRDPADVKRPPLPRRDTTLYKIHGDITRPDRAILTKEDYERYGNTHAPYVTSLQAALVERTFLFLGFSFTDPNVGQILARVRSLQDEEPREHYWIERRSPEAPAGVSPEARAEADYLRRKQALHLQDLRRYGIQAVLVDDYRMVPELLERLALRARSRTVFVSGSAHEYGTFGHTRAENLAKELGRRVIASGRRLVSGFGLGIGGAVLLGAWDEIYRSNDPALDDRLVLRPFPQGIQDPDERQRQWTAYREALLKDAGAVVVIAGNKLDAMTGSIVDADGVREEFEIAVARGAYPIPIGATGYVARQLWEAVIADPDRFLPGIDAGAELARLGDEHSTDDELIESVFSILERVRERSLIP